MLVGTKVDLLPPGTDPAAVADWLAAAAAFKRINAVSTHLVRLLDHISFFWQIFCFAAVMPCPRTRRVDGLLFMRQFLCCGAVCFSGCSQRNPTRLCPCTWCAALPRLLAQCPNVL